MDFSHKAALERMRPRNARARVGLLLDYADHPPQREVPDPYYGGQNSFEYALDLIELGIDGLMQYIGRTRGIEG